MPAVDQLVETVILDIPPLVAETDSPLGGDWLGRKRGDPDPIAAAAYGFIPGTAAPDGDPVVILVMTGEPAFPGCLVEWRPVAMLRMRDAKGADEKILAAPVSDPRYDEVRAHFLRELRP